MIPFAKSNLAKLTPLRLPDIHLTSGKISNSIVFMDELRNQLKTMNRQFDFYMKHKTAMKNNLIGTLDQTYPDVNAYFDSPTRSDGSQKWGYFASTYWHVDCVRKMSQNAFTYHYQNWCKRKKYNFSQSKAVDQLNSASTTVDSLRTLMNETASKLPKYPVVMAMKEVGTSLVPQLMAEIGDVSHFTHKGAITAFADVNPGIYESGSYEQKKLSYFETRFFQSKKDLISGNGCLN